MEVYPLMASKDIAELVGISLATVSRGCILIPPSFSTHNNTSAYKSATLR